MSAAPVLNILRNGETVKSVAIEGEALLGRGEACVIRLEDRAISRHHAMFKQVGDGVQVEKKSEFAPLLVNGLECTRALIKEGDVIAIGPYLMKLAMPKAAPEPASVPAPLPESPDPVLGSIDSPSGPLSNTPIEPMPEQLDASPIAPPTQDSEGEVAPVEASKPANEGPEEVDIGAEHVDIPVDEDAATRVTNVQKVAVKLLFKPGAANLEELEITKDEIVIGRGKNCDVVLKDKKSSRRNTIIRRQGMVFMVKDLDSANGTYLNGRRIKGEEPLTGDDNLRIGTAEFQFKALSTEYLAKEKDFAAVSRQPTAALSVPSIDPPSESFDSGFPVSVPQFEEAVPAASPTPGLEAVPGLAPASPSEGLTGIVGLKTLTKIRPKSLIDKFRALPPKRQALWAVLLLAGLYFLVLDEDEPASRPKTAVQRKAPNPSASGTVGGGGPSASFDLLSSEQKRFVEAQHALAFDLFRNKEYDKALFELNKIFQLVTDYKNAREIERYAKEGKRKLEALEEEKRKKEEELRVKAKLSHLIEDAREKMSAHDYKAAKELFEQILLIEPENADVAQWRKLIEDELEAQRMEEQKHSVRDELNKQARGRYREGMALFKKQRFFAAIDVFKTVLDVGAPDASFPGKVRKMIEACKQAIAAKRDPLLAQAKQLEQEVQLSKAYELFRQATVADPYHKEGYAGMERIRGVLHEKSKIIYTEAVLAESYSDFSTARRKFQEVITTAPEDDSYHASAKRKLSRYFEKEEVRE